MKNIVICLDGTWNTADAAFPTNVVKTAQLVAPVNAQGEPQVVFYDPGVGSMEVAFGNTVNSLLGGAFGVGLMGNIERAYRFLAFNYAPGDRIFIFGFSRGAFSARSLGGLIRTCGILHKEHIREVPKAIQTYRDREPGNPDTPECVQFRQRHAVASFHGGTGDEARLHPLIIDYLGIWDTVGSLGIPAHFLFANLFNQRYQFHDLKLSPMIGSARHAVSIDERRRSFAPALWDNLDPLNASRAAASRPFYEQVWFPGDHASVGGGGTVNGLWQAALLWVVEGARSRGLAVIEGELAQYHNAIDHRVAVYSEGKGILAALLAFSQRWRDGPAGAALAEVAEIGQLRLKAAAADLKEKRRYRPRPLRRYVEAFASQLGITWK